MLIASEKSSQEPHHVAGQRNSALTVALPANDHRAILSVNQYDWPARTLQNPDGSPLLAAAAALRGFADLIIYLLNALIYPVAHLLEALDEVLQNERGEQWWKQTPIAQWTPPWPK